MSGVYPELAFPEPSTDRPHVFINMVATIDGKIVSGDRTEGVQDLGSDVDHATMRQIESAADAIVIGASTLRASPKLWYPAHVPRFLVSASGEFPIDVRFFTDSPEIAFVLTSQSKMTNMPEGVQVMGFGESEIDFAAAFKWLRENMGVRKLLCEGGSKLNATLFAAGLIDEIFLTIAPKIKLGADTPTIADGLALPREEIQNFALIEHNVVGDELFLRYRR